MQQPPTTKDDYVQSGDQSKHKNPLSKNESNTNNDNNKNSNNNNNNNTNNIYVCIRIN